MTDTDETDAETMGDVSHANPNTNRTFGYSFRRGPAVTDGGETPASDDEETPTSEDDETMADVDHTPREGEGANEVWTRGRGDVDE